MYWFEDPIIIRQFPLPLRCYAAYCRSMVNRTTGTVRGGSFLLGIMRKVRQRLRGPDQTAVSLDGLTLYLDPYADRIFFAFDELLHGGDEGRVMRLNLNWSDTFLDVGANHGTYSLLARQLVGPTGSVLAFEPQPHLAELLRKSFQANGWSNCQVYEVALSDREGSTSFYIPQNSGFGGLHKAFSATSGSTELNVKLARFDHLIDWPSLPGKLFIKLDVEGSELQFLRGARQMIRSRRPTLLLEINPDSAIAAGSSTAELVAELRDLGYSTFAEMDRYPATAPLQDLIGERLLQFRDILVIP